MSRGKRYETEPKLNYQKVFAVIIAVVVIIMFIFIMKNVLNEREKITKDYEYFALYANNKWGVINQDGEQVIIPSYQEMARQYLRATDEFICNKTMQTTLMKIVKGEITIAHIERAKKERKLRGLQQEDQELAELIQYSEQIIGKGQENSLTIANKDEEGEQI